jgi:hypothetical protein
MLRNLRLVSCRRNHFSSIIPRRYASRLPESRKPFRYAPLDLKTNEIRLLTVLPSNQEKPNELQCSLKHLSLDSHGEYHALSYAWRDDGLYAPEENPASGEEIVVNDDLLTVGHNLAAALKARRSHGYRDIPLWVDAICINQHEADERSRQILRMRDIYARALKVTVWLGPEREDSRKAIDFIRMFYKKLMASDNRIKEVSTGTQQSSFWPEPTSKWVFSEWFKESLISRKYSDEWKAVYNLLRRAWWRRIWIVQEIVAAKQVELFCGSATLNSEHLSRFLKTLVAHGVYYIPLLEKHEGIVLEHSTFSLAYSYLRPESWKKVSLLQALYRTRMALSSEPRDKIYAVINLAEDGEKIVPHPNYSLSIQKIYAQLVVDMVKQTSRLDILSFVGLPVYSQELDSQIPTWVPNWSHRPVSTMNSYVGEVKPVWTDRNSKAVVTFRDDDRIMRVNGFIFDSIDGMASIGEATLPHQMLHQSKARTNPYTSWGPIDAICRSLVADLIPSGDTKQQEISIFLAQARNSHLDSSNPKLYTFANWYRSNRHLIVSGRTVEAWAHDPNLPLEDIAPPKDPSKDHEAKSQLEKSRSVSYEMTANDLFHYRLPSHWRSRRFITTMKGYAGLGPTSCVPGDLICIILGCATPIILRRVEGHFVVVGECYVHGIMHGETMADLDAGTYKLRDFEIW